MTSNSGAMNAGAPLRQSLLPRTQAAPGQVLWGEAPRRQPIVPLIAMAFLVLMVAAPAAMSSSGQSSNPIALLHETAVDLYTITTLMDTANGHLHQLDANTTPLRALNAHMMIIGAATKGMAEKTAQLDAQLATVGQSVEGSRGQLAIVDTKLNATASTMGGLKTSVDQSLNSTKGMVQQFGGIQAAIHKMDSGLKVTIRLMSRSTPLTTAFATNRTRMSITGGDGTKTGVPNIVSGSPVMGVVLPMITNLQDGGLLPVRKDSATGSNFAIGAIVNKQIPDNTNLAVKVVPFDPNTGLGMPGQDFFVTHRVDGF